MAVQRILRMPEVTHRTGLNALEVYRLIGRNEFPMPVEISANIVGWRLSTINRWIRERKVIPSIPTVAARREA